MFWCILPAMKIQLLYFDGCASWETALDNLKTACALDGLTWPIELIEMRDDDDAAARRFLGSPSIVVSGQDLCLIFAQRQGISIL